MYTSGSKLIFFSTEFWSDVIAAHLNCFFIKYTFFYKKTIFLPDPQFVQYHNVTN